MGTKRGTVQERFFRKVEKTDGCWLWRGGTNRRGYGRLNIDGVIVLAHRISYEMAKGPVPFGLCVCHHCDTPSCVNPAHLFAASQYENMQDMARKGRASETKGDKCGKAKLREAQVMEIISSKDRAKDLAPKYGVSVHTINNIRAGTRWAHLPRPTEVRAR